MTNDLSENGQEELFRDGVHLATYRDPEELLDKVRFYLRHEPLREQIAAAGRAEAVTRHTYTHRMRAILEAVENRQQRTTVAAAQLIPERVSELPANHRPQKDWSYFDFARPEVVAGHSYGELTALCASRRFAPAALYRLSMLRGRLMAEAQEVEGGMLAVGAPSSMGNTPLKRNAKPMRRAAVTATPIPSPRKNDPFMSNP